MANTPKWEKKKCSHCGTVFSVYKRRKAKFCSYKCSTFKPVWNKGTGLSVSRGYVRINSGWKAEHRVKMEEAMGRALKKGEVVHHWDENKQNNDISNLALLRHQAAHLRLHVFARRHRIPVSALQFEQPWLIT